MKSLYTLGVSILSWAICAPVSAEIKYFSLDKSPTPIEFARSLMGTDFKPATKLRGLRPVMMTGSDTPGHSSSVVSSAADATPAKSMSVDGDITARSSGNALAVPIPFGFNSARLVAVATRPLDDIAEGIKLIHSTSDVRIVIEGHTDANGGSGYNLKLSQWRAASVKRYLVTQHQIDPRLLVAKGFGQSLPINKSNRFADENRRVQFRVS
jgi:outer membrane protein OmpA-like peptidoglycan-associated protein